MINKMQLIEFEKQIEQLFLDKKILAPIHLSDNNEDQVLWIFKNLWNANDWLFTTWRSHYHVLCTGITEDWLKTEILRGASMFISHKSPNIVTSSIVGGIISQAVGTALSIKRNNQNNSVLCMVGDMGASGGAFHEAHKYALCQDLPIKFVIEDNGISVGSKTEECWGKDFWFSTENNFRPRKETCMPIQIDSKTWYYRYEKSIYPHVGAGSFVSF
jgi:pyruvate dehydrogenase E1 component alpha subunit